MYPVYTCKSSTKEQLPAANTSHCCFNALPLDKWKMYYVVVLICNFLISIEVNILKYVYGAIVFVFNVLLIISLCLFRIGFDRFFTWCQCFMILKHFYKFARSWPSGPLEISLITFKFDLGKDGSFLFVCILPWVQIRVLKLVLGEETPDFYATP